MNDRSFWLKNKNRCNTSGRRKNQNKNKDVGSTKNRFLTGEQTLFSTAFGRWMRYTHPVLAEVLWLKAVITGRNYSLLF